MKKFTAIVLVLLLFLFTASLAFASTTTATDSDHQTFTFSQDTVITEDNMINILKYYGLDPSAIVKNDRPVTGDVTVRDLEKAINYAKKLPDELTICNDNPTNIKAINNDIIIQSTGTATVYHNAIITSSLTMTYSAIGKFYKSGSTKYWTEALGSNIAVGVDSSSPPYFWRLDAIRKNTNTLFNGGTTNSYLQMDYDYTVGYYMGISGGWAIRISQTPINGFTRFNSSTIP